MLKKDIKPTQRVLHLKIYLLCLATITTRPWNHDKEANKNYTYSEERGNQVGGNRLGAARGESGALIPGF